MNYELCLSCGSILPEPTLVEFDPNQLQMFDEYSIEPHDPYWKYECEDCGACVQSEQPLPTLRESVFDRDQPNHYQTVNLPRFTRAVFNAGVCWGRS